MDDHDGHIGHACQLQQTADGLGLGLRRAAEGVRRRRKRACGLLFGDERIDHAGVLAVHADDAAETLHLAQGVEHGLIADHHRGIGHVHFEGGDALVEHLGQLGADAVVPVVDGHVEAVVAAGLPVRLLMPAGKAGVERFALVRAGKVDDGRRAAAQGGAAAGVEVVRCDGVADLKVEVCVRVEKAGEQQLAADVDLLGLRAGKRLADGLDAFAVDEQIGFPAAGSADDHAAFQQLFHTNPLLFVDSATPHHSASAFGGYFSPVHRFGKFDVHKARPHFPNLASTKNLSPDALEE